MSSRIIQINVLGENIVAADNSTDIESMSHIQMLAPAKAAIFWPLTGWGTLFSLLGDYNLTKKPVELFHFRPLLIFARQYLQEVIWRGGIVCFLLLWYPLQLNKENQ
jgi:hypothetical protein